MLPRDSSNDNKSANSGSSSGKRVVVIGAYSDQDNQRLHVTSNSVQPIFKVEKVPSNSLSGNSCADQSLSGSNENSSVQRNIELV